MEMKKVNPHYNKELKRFNSWVVIINGFGYNSMHHSAWFGWIHVNQKIGPKQLGVLWFATFKIFVLYIRLSKKKKKSKDYIDNFVVLNPRSYRVRYWKVLSLKGMLEMMDVEFIILYTIEILEVLNK